MVAGAMVRRLVRTAKEAPLVVFVTFIFVFILWRLGYDVVTIASTSILAAIFIFWFRRFFGIR